MFTLIEPNLHSSHVLRDKAWRHFRTGHPGGAIDLFRRVGFDECEIMLSKSFRHSSKDDQVKEIDHRQRQARTRIQTTRNVLRNNELPRLRDQMAQSIHEDEGIIMGLERLRCLTIGQLPEHNWEAYIEGEKLDSSL